MPGTGQERLETCRLAAGFDNTAMKASPAVSRTEIPVIPVRRGKVRDVYDLGDRLVIVATDRISAFDWVLPTPIPDKGPVLTSLTLFWLRWLKVQNHLISAES